MGKHWAWSEEKKKQLTEDSLFNHPDEGCQYSKKCLRCPYSECYQVIGIKKFREAMKV